MTLSSLKGKVETTYSRCEEISLEKEFGQIPKGKRDCERTQGLLEVILGKAYIPNNR